MFAIWNSVSPRSVPECFSHLFQDIEGVEVIEDDQDVWKDSFQTMESSMKQGLDGVGSMSSAQSQAKQREMPFSSIQSLPCRPHVECR